MQQYAVRFILLQSHSTCFGCPLHTSSGVLKTVSAASGTGHNIGTTTSPPTWPDQDWFVQVVWWILMLCVYIYIYIYIKDFFLFLHVRTVSGDHLPHLAIQ
jgi:hypothetical protein